MTSATRLWLAPVVLAIGVGFAALSPQVQAQDSLTRVLVNVADVVMRGGVPYYRYGNNGYGDRLAVQHDHNGHPTYYRTVNSNAGHHDDDNGAYGNSYSGNINSYGNTGYYGNNGYYGSNGYPPYGNANGYYGNPPHGNANGYYRNGQSRSSQQNRKRDQHKRHDCQAHGKCGH